MDTQSLNALKPGVYVIGKILSCTAALFNRKDGTGQFVVTRLEVATKPGVVTIERIFDPAKDAEVNKDRRRDVSELPRRNHGRSFGRAAMSDIP